ncbi:MAG: hypothetical protein LUF34_04655 [Lachnospiraceae bacterium]|nr:hypothetical protein [Lachnospiraceae bacterium]
MEESDACEKNLCAVEAGQSDAREEAARRLREHPTEDALWAALRAFQGYPFRTAKGLTFTYTVRGGELFVDRKEKSITRATVDLAFRRALELQVVTGPKKLGVFGASYLYPIFLHLGIITREPVT